MKATMSTAAIGVSLAQQSSPAAFSDGSDSGFSEVLSGVRTQQTQQGAVGSVRKENASYAETAGTSVNPDTAKAEAPEAKPISENAETVQTDANVRTDANAGVNTRPDANADMNAEDPAGEKIIATFTDMEYRAVSGTLKEELNQLVIRLSNGDEDEEGKIIDELLKILKEMQEKEGSDESISLAMLFLAAMLGGAETQTAETELTVTVKNVSAEITEISESYRSEMTLTESSVFSEGTALSEEESSEEIFPGEVLSEEAALSEGTEVFEEAADIRREEPAVHTEAVTAGEPLAAEMKPLTAEAKPLAAEAKPLKAETKPLTAETGSLTEETKPQTVGAERVTSEPVEAAAPNERESVKTAEMPEQILPMRETAEQPEIPTERSVTAQEQPIRTIREAEPKTAEQLLSDILDKARRELGLTKAEFTEEPKTAEARTEVRLPQAEESAADENRPDSGEQNPRFSARELFLSPNHKDGRSELERILDGGKEQRFDPNAAIPRETAAVRETELPLGNEPKTDAIPIERQLTDELLARSETVNGGRSEFTMVLNPESLGRITVRLISAGGRVQVSIAAENDATRQLLQSRSDHIGTALKNNGVELERYQVVSGREEAQLMQDNYDGSSKNPYGHREEPAEEQPADDGEDFLEILQQL